MKSLHLIASCAVALLSSSLTWAETNFALRANGGVVTASSEFNSMYPARALNNNERAGDAFGLGDVGGNRGGWMDGTPGIYPDTVQVQLNGVKAIDKVVVYSAQDSFMSTSAVEPTDTMTFTTSGVTDFTVKGWDGAAWQTLGTVTGNNLVKRSVTFAAFTTTKIRIVITGALGGASRLTEVEAWGVDSSWSFPWAQNVALASLGSVATASSQFSANFPPASAIDGEPLGLNWGGGGGWADGTVDRYPDWLEVDFPAPQPISHIVVYTVQDNYSGPTRPTDFTTFTQYGILDFTVQGWDGTQWVTLATIVNNNLVKRTIDLGAGIFTTSKIRVNVTRANGIARITELEAWVHNGGLFTQPTGTNIASALEGATVIASSQFDTGYPAASVIDGDPSGTGWSTGTGGWADASMGMFPDFLDVYFATGPGLATQTIDHVVVYSLQDNWQSPSPPTDSMTFTQYGITDFQVQGWNGTQWILLGNVTGNNLVKRTVAFAPFTGSAIRIVVVNALNGFSRIAQVEAWTGNVFPPPPPIAYDVALASNGATASASSQFGPGFPVSAVIDGTHTGANWTNGGGWADGTIDAFPDWVEVDFQGAKNIDHVVVYTLQDNWQAPVEPSSTLTFTQYGIQDFTVQGWNGTQWVTLGTVTGNNLVKRTVTFAATTVDRVRINVTRAKASLARITEIEAWGTDAGSIPPPPTPVNVALAANGGIASASSQYGPGFPVAAVNNNDRTGANWTSGGGWADGTIGAYPDWVEIDFSGTKTLSSVVLYTLQDNWQAPVEPTDTMMFSQYGITDFTVQAWNGSAWQTVGTVSGNMMVKRSVPVSVTTSKIRINVTGALNSLARITEIEAYGN